MKLPSTAHANMHLARSAEDGENPATGTVWKMTRTLEARDSSSSSTSTDCPDGADSGFCQKPTDSTNTQTLPIVLGAVIPILCAICVFIYLHRKNKKKQALEDANDPHKSLDFGVEIGGGPSARAKKQRFGRNRGPPEMTISAPGQDIRPGKKPRGMSMDMLGSPYLLPAGLHGSRESLHSMSRNIQDEHDPYRPVTFMRGSSETSRSPRPFNENGSMYSASTVQTGNEKGSLVDNARGMPQSFPRRGDSMKRGDSPSDSTTPEEFQGREMFSASRNGSMSRKASMNSSTTPTLANISENSPPMSRKEELPPLPPMPQEAYAAIVDTPMERSESLSQLPPRNASLAAGAQQPMDVRASDASYYGEELPPPPPPPKIMTPEDEIEDPTDMYTGRFSIDNSAPSQQFAVQNNRMSMMGNNRVSVMGLRPLPNMDDQAENAEQRANRIRSFYKEYFDDSRPNPQNAMYEDYDTDFLDAAIYDPETGNFVYPQAPYAQPMGRRAMTPPPRGAAPRFPGGHDRHYSTMSAGGPRGRPGPRMPPKKKLPPPKALQGLPTPHMLKDDSMMLMNPVDFAPPTSFREMQNGRRPDSPMGVSRPFSPSVKAFSPLVPAFDELQVIPSPHHLRKSGTYSALDFAPPKFRAQDGTASDAGSIRSARSGISAMQMDAVRAGAYRVSRIPKEYVTSKDDLSTQLKPQMNLIRPA